MSETTCKVCGKELGAGNWESSRVIKREPGPSDYFQTPSRTWELRAGGVEAYIVGGALLCAKCYHEQVAHSK